MNRPQYQFSIYWMKFLFKEYLNNFNILPVGLETERPLLYKMMIEISKIFSEKYVNWCEIENVKRKKLHEIKMKKASDKNQIKPFVPYSSKFLNNSGILCSKLIYNLFLVDYSLVKTLDNNFEKSEREFIFANMHKSLNSSKVRLTNFKLIHHGLATNSKFKNRYDKVCFMCKKTLNENFEHIFVKCDLAKQFYEYIRNEFMIKKNLQNSLVLLKFKHKLTEKDYKVLSCYAYCVWRVRNECKHQNNVNPFETFKALFNKWYISITET